MRIVLASCLVRGASTTIAMLPLAWERPMLTGTMDVVNSDMRAEAVGRPHRRPGRPGNRRAFDNR